MTHMIGVDISDIYRPTIVKMNHGSAPIVVHGAHSIRTKVCRRGGGQVSAQTKRRHQKCSSQFLYIHTPSRICSRQQMLSRSAGEQPITTTSINLHTTRVTSSRKSKNCIIKQPPQIKIRGEACDY